MHSKAEIATSGSVYLQLSDRKANLANQLSQLCWQTRNYFHFAAQELYMTVHLPNHIQRNSARRACMHVCSETFHKVSTTSRPG